MKHKIAITAVLAVLVLSGEALAQTPAQPGPGNNAVNSPGQNNAKAPVEGRNSFTEGQAKDRIEAAGYSQVSGLKKDDTGVWRGKASKGGQVRDVSLDFQGNVIPN
jgi:hypothetical protein